MSNPEPKLNRFIRLKGRRADANVEFCFVPSDEDRNLLIERFELRTLKKVRFEGTLAPQDKADWQLSGTLGATAVQSCVVTLGPVTTRVDVPVVRRYLADPEPEPVAEEIEIPEDDSIEPMPDEVDLLDLLSEALGLALPDFPRATDAELEQTTFTEPGKTPLEDADTSPFAALKALKDNKQDD